MFFINFEFAFIFWFWRTFQVFLIHLKASLQLPLKDPPPLHPPNPVSLLLSKQIWVLGLSIDWRTLQRQGTDPVLISSNKGFAIIQNSALKVLLWWPCVFFFLRGGCRGCFVNRSCLFAVLFVAFFPLKVGCFCVWVWEGINDFDGKERRLVSEVSFLF